MKISKQRPILQIFGILCLVEACKFFLSNRTVGSPMLRVPTDTGHYYTVVHGKVIVHEKLTQNRGFLLPVMVFKTNNSFAKTHVFIFFPSPQALV